MKDRFYPRVLQAFIIMALVTLIMFITSLSIAMGPGLDWELNYGRAECVINSVETMGEVECSVPASEVVGTDPKAGLFDVPCVQVNVTYTNSSGSTRLCEVAMPTRSLLLAENSGGSALREYKPTDYRGEPLPGPNGKPSPRRTSTLTRALLGTTRCTFLDCRSDPGQAKAAVDAIAERYKVGDRLPCWYYEPDQHKSDLSALVVLKQVQSDGEVLAWTVITLLGLMLTWPCCLFLCCREWLCRCPGPIRNLQYF